MDFNISTIDLFVFVSSLLVAISVLASRASGQLGVPSLLLFLGLGMLAGSEGVGGIDFDNYSLTYSVGSIALVLILFDGGLRSSWKSFKPFAKPGVSLSFFGVLITALATGCFAHYVLKLSWAEAMLLGSIVSSTDAAAVFSSLRNQNLTLRTGLKEVLELEAGSNDPTAIFLTLIFLDFITKNSSTDNVIGLFLFNLFKQFSIGLLFGWFGGKFTKWIINHSKLGYEGLYNVLCFAMAFFIFSGTSIVGGNGFLGVYVAGLVLGNSELINKGNILRFHDGIAWIAQISLFLLLGLLVFPSHLLAVWKEGIVLALFLIIVARPLSVFISTAFSSLKKSDRVFISWVGLRGAAPILLATLPWIGNVPNAEYFFNLVFFVVLVSILFQGTTIAWVAKKLNLIEAIENVQNFSANPALLPPGFCRIEFIIAPSSTAVGVQVANLELPSGVLLTSLEREGRFTIPSGQTEFAAGDKIWALVRKSHLGIITEVFGNSPTVT